MNEFLSRRELLMVLAAGAAASALPAKLLASAAGGDTLDTDAARLKAWAAALRSTGMNRRSLSLGPRAIKVGELAIGTPYVPNTLEAYIKAGGDPTRAEPITLSLTQ